jgi:hypothetical protein
LTRVDLDALTRAAERPPEVQGVTQDPAAVAVVPESPPDVVAGYAAGANPAVDALLAAFDSARGGLDVWVAHSVRLPLALSQEVAKARARDIRRLDLPVPAAHYLEAALSRLPARSNGAIEPLAAGEIGLGWRMAHVRDRSGTSAPGNRLRQVTSKAMKALGPDLDLLPYTVTLQDVAAGAVARFLAELSGDGGLP